MKRIEISLVIGFVISVAVCSMGSFAQECEYLRDNVLRIHILANSDSSYDQQLKLKVRDAVLAQQESIFSCADSIEEAEQNAEKKLELIEAVAAEVIANEGFEYSVKAEIVNMYFDTRHYDGFDMPAGRYDAIRVTIGSGKGKNWWCVAYPPMCIDAARPAGESGELTETKILSLAETPVYRPKLAVIELYENLKEKFAKLTGDNADLSIDEQS